MNTPVLLHKANLVQIILLVENFPPKVLQTSQRNLEKLNMCRVLFCPQRWNLSRQRGLTYGYILDLKAKMSDPHF